MEAALFSFEGARRQRELTAVGEIPNDRVMALVTGRRSACNEAARKAQQAELMKLTPLERMKIALRTGHTAYRLRDLGAKHHVPKR